MPVHLRSILIALISSGGKTFLLTHKALNVFPIYLAPPQQYTCGANDCPLPIHRCEWNVVCKQIKDQCNGETVEENIVVSRNITCHLENDRFSKYPNYQQ